MSGIEEVINYDEKYLRILYFTNLDDVKKGLIDDLIPKKTVIFVRVPSITHRGWYTLYLNLKSAARLVQVYLINTISELNVCFEYQVEGKQHLLW